MGRAVCRAGSCKDMSCAPLITACCVFVLNVLHAGVHQFMRRAIAAAQGSGAVSTLMGRRRPIAGLAGDFHERSAAERKVLNSQIQVG